MALYKDVSSLEVVGYTEPKNGTFSDGVDFVLEKLDAIPEADVESVRHGYWIKTGWQQSDKLEYKCSECKRNKIWRKKTQKLPKYCEKCGAKMDGKEKEQWLNT